MNIAAEAARLAFLHDVGAISSPDIIRWVDEVIASSDKPSAHLIDLSTAPGDQIRDSLSALAAGADVWTPIYAALPTVLQHVRSDPDRAPVVAAALYHLAVEQRYDVPEPLRFITSAEDDFSLAKDGVFTFNDVYLRFLADLEAATGRPA